MQFNFTAIDNLEEQARTALFVTYRAGQPVIKYLFPVKTIDLAHRKPACTCRKINCLTGDRYLMTGLSRTIRVTKALSLLVLPRLSIAVK